MSAPLVGGTSKVPGNRSRQRATNHLSSNLVRTNTNACPAPYDVKGDLDALARMDTQLVPKNAKDDHVRRTVNMAMDLQRMLDMTVVKVHGGKVRGGTGYASGYIKMKTKPDEPRTKGKIFYLFALPAVMETINQTGSKSMSFPPVVERRRKKMRNTQSRTLAPKFQHWGYAHDFFNENEGLPYAFPTHGVFLTSKFGGIVLQIIPMVGTAAKGDVTYLMDVRSVGYHASPLGTGGLGQIANRGESTYEDLKRVVTHFKKMGGLVVLQDAAYNRKVQCHYWAKFILSAFEQTPLPNGTYKVGMYDKFVTYPQSARSIIHNLVHMNAEKRKRIKQSLEKSRTERSPLVGTKNKMAQFIVHHTYANRAAGTSRYSDKKGTLTKTGRNRLENDMVRNPHNSQLRSYDKDGYRTFSPAEFVSHFESLGASSFDARASSKKRSRSVPGSVARSVSRKASKR